MESHNEILKGTFWTECKRRLRSEEAFILLKEVIDHAARSLEPGGFTIRATDPKTVSFIRKGREILTVNVGLSGLRIYVHPAAGANFEPGSQFQVERFRFWDSSYQKSSGTYRGMSVWGSGSQDLPGIKQIIDRIPE